MRYLLLLCVLALATPPAANAQINGDFENGIIGWVFSGPFGSSVPATGGNPDGYGRIRQNIGNSGTGSIAQIFTCGTGAGTCEVTFDYKLSVLSGPGVGDFVVALDTDSNVLFTTPLADGQWHTHTVSYPCGTHELMFQLVVQVEVIQEMEVCVDNVSAVCVAPTPVESATWGRLKRLF